MPAAVGSQGVRERVDLDPPSRRVLRRGAQRRRRPDGGRRAEGDQGRRCDDADGVPFRLPRRVLSVRSIEPYSMAPRADRGCRKRWSRRSDARRQPVRREKRAAAPRARRAWTRLEITSPSTRRGFMRSFLARRRGAAEEAARAPSGHTRAAPSTSHRRVELAAQREHHVFTSGHGETRARLKTQAVDANSKHKRCKANYRRRSGPQTPPGARARTRRS